MSNDHMNKTKRLTTISAMVLAVLSCAYPSYGQDAAPITAAPAISAPGLAAQQAEPPQQGLQAGNDRLHLLVGRSLVISSPTRVKRISVADANIADAIVISPYQVLLNGKTPGGVSLIIWDESDQSQTFEIFVDLDILGLSQKIREVFRSE